MLLPLGHPLPPELGQRGAHRRGDGGTGRRQRGAADPVRPEQAGGTGAAHRRHPPAVQGRPQRLREGRRAGVFDGPGRQHRGRYAVAALRLHLDDHPDHRVRAEYRYRRAPPAEGAAGDRL
ncbi:hypothetical protein G6F60_015083 [Rhizopus arrhizus]|nr:hypothetical protein G6F60_015083 [Rhizopus arrhizus]